MLLLHDEPVLLDGRRIGRVTSGAYGWTLRGACGVALVDAREPLEGDPIRVTVTCGVTPVPATLSTAPFYDPTGSRLR